MQLNRRRRGGSASRPSSPHSRPHARILVQPRRAENLALPPTAHGLLLTKAFPGTYPATSCRPRRIATVTLFFPFFGISRPQLASYFRLSRISKNRPAKPENLQNLKTCLRQPHSHACAVRGLTAARPQPCAPRHRAHSGTWSRRGSHTCSGFRDRKRSQYAERSI